LKKIKQLMQPKTATIIGSGYVGVTTAAIFANAGYKVYALEINSERLAAIRRGKSFFYEEYLNPLLEHALKTGQLLGTSSYGIAIPESDIIFSCVGTPDNPDGSSNLNYVYAAAAETAEYIKPGAIFVQKSTVPVGTGKKVEKVLRDISGYKIDYVSNPEFLRESTAIQDSLWPDRVVIGGSDDSANRVIERMYRQVIYNREALAAIADIPFTDELNETTPRYIKTSRNSAELIKVSANAFLALKISFANSMAKLADATGADVVEVMQAVGADNRIGRHFLNAGRGYGGGCFPKDVNGLISSGLEHGVDLNIMQAVNSENASMPGYILEKALKHYNGQSLIGKKVALLGASFKAGTSDVRKSPALTMANLLADKLGARVHIYDPEAFTEEVNIKEVNGKIKVSPTMDKALRNAEMAVLATDWPEFRDFSTGKLARLLKGKLVVDAMNCLNPDEVKRAGLTYIGVGRS
jgi:UDPglucose 6-dehydrogenase